MSSSNVMKKILIISDEPAVVELIKYAVNLLQGPYQIFGMHNSVQALERIVAEKPDCIIIDIRQSLMDGNQLVRLLRYDNRTVDIPLIILKAMKREEDSLVELLSETDEYLTKPFKPTTLNAAIERILRSTE